MIAAGLWAAAIALGWAVAPGGAAPASSPEGTSSAVAPTVALIVPAESHGRLAEELRRELEASQFSVLSLPSAQAGDGARASAEEMLRRGGGAGGAGPGGQLIAVVAADEGRITIYARGATAADALQTTPLFAEQDDRPARRRLCLAVVEHLRRIGVGPVSPGEAAHLGPAPAVAMTTIAATPPGSGLAAPAAAAPALATAPAAPAGSRRAWWFGVASDLNVLSARGTPTAHVTLLAERVLTAHVALAGRAAWPILGAQFIDQERSIRTWTFVGELGVQFLLRDRTAALRPMVGAATGLRTALADTDEFEMRASRIVVSPALSFALNAGVRYRIRPLVDLILAADVSQGLLLLTDRRDYEAASARERLVRLSLGLLFEY